MVQPSWQAEILVEVGRLYNRKHYPKLIWRNGSRPSSSGHYYPKKKRIVVTAGTSGKDHEQVLLHELAHWLTPRSRAHGRRFWQVLYRLLEHFKIRDEEYVKREFRYMKMAETVYQELYS